MGHEVYPEDIAAVMKMDEFQHDAQRMQSEKSHKKSSSKRGGGGGGTGTRKSSRDITETM